MMESDDLDKFTDKETEGQLKKSNDDQFEYITELRYGVGNKENVVVVFRINKKVKFLTRAAYARNVPKSKPTENDDNQVPSMSSVPTDNMRKRGEISRVYAGAGSDKATDSHQSSKSKSKIEWRSSPPRTSHKIQKTIEPNNGDSSTSETEEEQRPMNKRSVRESPHVSRQRNSSTPSPVQVICASNKSNSYSSGSESDSALKKAKARARKETRRSPQRSSRSNGDESSDGSESPYIRNGISGETPEREEGGEIICGSTFTGKTKAIVQRGEAYDIEKVHECPEKLLTHAENSQGFSPEVDKLFFQCEARTNQSYTENFEMVGCAAKWHGHPKAWIFILIEVSNQKLQKSLNDRRKEDGLKYRGLLICDLSTFKKVVKNYEGELEKAGNLLKRSLLYTNCKPEDQKILSAKFMKGEAKRRKSKYVIELEESKKELE